MHVQPASSIAELVAGTSPAAAAPAAGEPQDLFATLLAALVAPMPGPEQPQPAGPPREQLQASGDMGEPALVPGRHPAADPLGRPAAGSGSPGATEIPTATPAAGNATGRPDRPIPPAIQFAAAGTQAEPVLGVELPAGRSGPKPTLDAPPAAGAPRAGQPGPAADRATQAQAILILPESVRAGREPNPAPGRPPQLQAVPGLPDAARVGREPGLTMDRPTESQATSPGAPRPPATYPADPGSGPERPTPGSAGGNLFDPGHGPDTHLEPGEPTLGRTERFSPAPASPAAPAPARPAGEGVAGQIGVQIVRAASSELRQVVVQLEPAELGRVHIRLEFTDQGGLKALIAAERGETLELLQRDVQALERSLQESGLRLDSGGVGFSLRRERGQDGRDHRTGTTAAEATREPFDSQTGTAAPSTLILRLLDIHA